MPNNENSGLTPEEEQYVPEAVKRQLKAAEDLVNAPADVVEADDKVEALEQEVETPIQPNKKPEDFRHKYDVLKGKYDKEIAELGSRLQALSRTIESQTSMIDDLKAQNTQLLEKKASAETQAATVMAEALDETAFEGYGDNIVSLVRQLNKLTKAAGSQQVAPSVNTEISDRLARIEERSNQSAEQEYFAQLADNVPDWREINRDPKFTAWLGQQDPITEIVRLQAIKRGASMFNSRQVINIFNAYKAEAGISTKAKVTKKKIGDQVQVVPKTSAAGADGDPTDADRTKYATKEEFTAAKNLFIKGRLSEADYNKVSNRFQAAIRDKRVL